MRDGFIKVATASPDLRVADTVYNVEKIIADIEKAYAEGVHILAFPELCVTGYTCGDLFLHRTLIDAAKAGVEKIVKATEGKKMLVFVGAPIRAGGKLYDCAIAISDGKVLGIVPKTYLSNSGESYEARVFHADDLDESGEGIEILGQYAVVGAKQLVTLENVPECTVACELGDDLFAVTPPSLTHAAAGATVIVNLSASAEIVGRAEKRRLAVKEISSRICGAYIYANAGSGESTTDGVFAGHSLIAENGHILAERKSFDEGMQTAVIDVLAIVDKRIKKNTFPANHAYSNRTDVWYARSSRFSIPEAQTETPKLKKRPFLPENEKD